MWRFSTDAQNNTWDSLIASDSHYFEYRVRIAGTYYGSEVLIETTADYYLFSGSVLGVGGCVAGELTLKMLSQNVNIPRMALVEPFVRVTDGTTYSAWMPQGKYYIDTREETKNDDGLPVLTLHCYDAMLKAEADYPSTTHDWPYSDINVVKEIAYTMGLQSSASATSGVDARTRGLMNAGYQIGLPAGYSMREVLENIGAMYGGNWVMTYDNKLMMVPLASIPADTNYLADSNGNWITFGGDRILV